MWQVYIGCDEWQDCPRFEDVRNAEKYISEWHGNFIMGLYPATHVWIENLQTMEKIVFLETGDEDEDN